MSNERADEFLSWRGRLTPSDALPEQGLEDKELSWQRLAERLQKQPRRHNIAWWIAAACLILAFFLPATHLFRGGAARPARVAARVPSRIPARIPTLPPPDRPSANAGANTVTLRKSLSPQPLSPQPISSHPVMHPSISTYGEIAAITITAASPQTPPVGDTMTTITPTPSLVAATSSLVAAPPPHRSLRIAYLNEINSPGPALLRITRPPAFLHVGTLTGAEYIVNNNNPIIQIDISSSPSH